MLAAEQHGLARAFARKGANRFAAIPWRPSPHGNPLVDGALAWLDCEVEAIHEAGDHELVLGRVRWLETAEREPLVFFRGLFADIVPPRPAD
jgi:flavin reductase (DIM6/NTAB) family NADH-FMN oxidoreductase RutF